MKNLKLFITECLFFTKPLDGEMIPNWVLAIYSWLQIFIIAVSVLSIIQKLL